MKCNTRRIKPTNKDIMNTVVHEYSTNCISPNQKYVIECVGSNVSRNFIYALTARASTSVVIGTVPSTI